MFATMNKTRTAAALCTVAMALTIPAMASANTSGCSDGSREGYLNESTHPDIAACGGAWTIPGIANFAPAYAPACPGLVVNDTRSPACGRQAGDDSANPNGTGCNAEDLCAEGWHICLDIKDIKAASPTPTNVCSGSVPAGTGSKWFASRQATNGCGKCADGTSTASYCNSQSCGGNCLNTEWTTNDVYGCGNIGAGGSCGGNGMTWTGNLCASIAAWGWSCNLPTSADNSGLCETYTLVHSNPSTGGVLCCRDATSPDTDGDGIPDNTDNCIGVPNPDQSDIDQDGFGDVCDSFSCFDDDNDGICNNGDNCPQTANPGQEDGDADGIGDACDVANCTQAQCDDGNACTDDVCDPNVGCQYSFNSGACTDGNACTANDACAGGACVAGGAVTCDDGNPCTTDSCNATSGCAFAANTLGCDDGNACTTADTCAASACVGGAALACDDGNPCTTDSCNPASGCVFAANSLPCDDGNACTTADTCAGSACVGGAAPNCDDGDTCTADSCNPATGCVSTPVDTDGDGVLDCHDQCAGTASGAVINSDGCSIDDLCDCDTAVNHGAYVSCVVHQANAFRKAGLITQAQATQRKTDAAHSLCGMPPQSNKGKSK